MLPFILFNRGIYCVHSVWISHWKCLHKRSKYAHVDCLFNNAYSNFITNLLAFGHIKYLLLTKHQIYKTKMSLNIFDKYIRRTFNDRAHSMLSFLWRVKSLTKLKTWKKRWNAIRQIEILIWNDPRQFLQWRWRIHEKLINEKSRHGPHGKNTKNFFCQDFEFFYRQLKYPQIVMKMNHYPKEAHQLGGKVNRKHQCWTENDFDRREI